MGADDSGIDRFQRRIGESQLLGLIAAQIVQDGIRGRREPVKGFQSQHMLQVERAALLVETEGLKVMAGEPAHEIRAHATARIPALISVLDLYDLGAEVI